jgi:DNA-binding transcriptional ArsR family regulator
MTTPAAADDALWSAIGDPTRRRMLDLLLTDGDGTATTLGQQLPISRQAVAKHLTVLGRAGLIRPAATGHSGRERRYRVDDTQLARAVAQLATVGSTWDNRLQRIRRLAETIGKAQEQKE